MGNNSLLSGTLTYLISAIVLIGIAISFGSYYKKQQELTEDDNETDYAPAPHRLLAFLLDIIPAAIICNAAYAFVSKTPGIGKDVIVFLICPIAVLIYFTLAESLWGATIGKIILKIRVVRSSAPEKYPSLSAAAARNLTKFFFIYSFITLWEHGGYSFKKQIHRVFHDIVSGTKVINDT